MGNSIFRLAILRWVTGTFLLGYTFYSVQGQVAYVDGDYLKFYGISETEPLILEVPGQQWELSKMGLRGNPNDHFSRQFPISLDHQSEIFGEPMNFRVLTELKATDFRGGSYDPATVIYASNVGVNSDPEPITEVSFCDARKYDQSETTVPGDHMLESFAFSIPGSINNCLSQNKVDPPKIDPPVKVMTGAGSCCPQTYVMWPKWLRLGNFGRSEMPYQPVGHVDELDPHDLIADNSAANEARGGNLDGFMSRLWGGGYVVVGSFVVAVGGIVAGIVAAVIRWFGKKKKPPLITSLDIPNGGMQADEKVQSDLTIRIEISGSGAIRRLTVPGIDPIALKDHFNQEGNDDWGVASMLVGATNSKDPHAKLDVRGKTVIGNPDNLTVTNQLSAVLFVDHGIVSRRQAVADPCDWSGAHDCPDFVFEKDYLLPDLEEKELFVRENRHLPHIPGVNELQRADSYSVKSMIMGQLMNVEEIYLYMIQQENSLNVSHESLKRNGQRINALEDKLNALKDETNHEK